MKPKQYLAQQPIDDFGLQQSDHIYAILLPNASDETLTIPADAPRYKAVIQYGGDVWVALNAAASVPGAAFAAHDSELNPPCREVVAGDALHFFTSGTNIAVSVALYEVA